MPFGWFMYTLGLPRIWGTGRVCRLWTVVFNLRRLMEACALFITGNVEGWLYRKDRRPYWPPMSSPAAAPAIGCLRLWIIHVCSLHLSMVIGRIKVLHLYISTGPRSDIEKTQSTVGHMLSISPHLLDSNSAQSSLNKQRFMEVVKPCLYGVGHYPLWHWHMPPARNEGINLLLLLQVGLYSFLLQVHVKEKQIIHGQWTVDLIYTVG